MKESYFLGVKSGGNSFLKCGFESHMVGQSFHFTNSIRYVLPQIIQLKTFTVYAKINGKDDLTSIPPMLRENC